MQEVNNISPLSYCRGQRPDITLIGTELDANLDQHLANCRFSNQFLELEFSMEENVLYMLYCNFYSISIPIPDTEPTVTASQIVCPNPDTGNFTG